MKNRVDVLELFKADNVVKVCAPMVRYSKLEFRSLVRKYGCQLCFTPMIMADSFVQSLKARNNEFTTNIGKQIGIKLVLDDSPVIVQFASKTVDDIVRATELVSPYCDGVDLNCGCPQRWAMNDGYGAHLLSKPHLVKDIVRQIRNVISTSNFTFSVKIRLLDDLRQTIEFCRNLEFAGVSFLTVHGRTVKERTEPVNSMAIKEIVQSVQVPVIANGDVRSLSDCCRMNEMTQCAGVMSARGILQNPALFSGFEVTPSECIQDWINISLSSQIGFQSYHHHLVFMLEKVLPKRLRIQFNNLQTFDKVNCFLEEYLSLRIPPVSISERQILEYIDVNNGSFFKSKVNYEESDFEKYLEDSCMFYE